MNPYAGLTDKVQEQLGDFLGRLEGYQKRKNDRYTKPDKQGDIVPKGYYKGQLSQFTPEQTELFKNLFGYLSSDSYLARLASGDEELFNEIEAPAHRMFQQKLGELGSRYSQLAPGAMSAQRGSGFQQAGGQLASDFAQDLASRRQDLQRQAILDLQGLSRELLGQRPYEKFLTKKQYPQQQPDQSGDLFGGLLSGIAGAGAGAAFGGPAGAVAGGAGGFYKGYNGGF